MKRCKQCGSEFADSTTVCPTCESDVSKVANFEQLKLDKSTKITVVIMAFLLVFIIAAIGSCSNDNKQVPTSSTPVQKSSPVSQSKAPPSEGSKNVAATLDDRIYTIVTDSEKVTATLQEGMKMFSQEQITALELYDLAKDAKEAQFSLWSNVSKLDGDNNKAYVRAVESYIVNNQQFAENLLKYLDKQELKYLSKAKSNIESSSSYVLSVVTERTKYLSNQGFSDTEVNEILLSSSNSEN